LAPPVAAHARREIGFRGQKPRKRTITHGRRGNRRRRTCHLQAGRKLLEQINGDPKTRSLLTRAIKAHYPNTRTEEDIAAEVAGPYIEEVKGISAKLQEQLDALTTERTASANERAREQTTAAFDRLRQAHGYNDDGINAIKQLMVDRSIGDPEAAALLFEKQNPQPDQTRSSWEPASWDLKNNAVDYDLEGLWADPEKWSDKMIGKVLLEERSKNAA